MNTRIKFAMMAVTCCSGMAVAQPPGGDQGLQRMLSFDKNEDGVVSKDEIPERLHGLFARADKDDDGQLTKEEITADRHGRGGDGRGGDGRGGDGRGGDGRGMGDRGAGRRAGGMPPHPVLIALDANHDGELSADEINNATAALKKLDRNDNGRIEVSEMRPPRREGDDQAEGRQRNAAGGESRNMVQFMLKQHDADGDGKISGDELPERMRANLAQIDSNDDNAVDKAELEAMAQKMRERGFGKSGQGGRGRGPRGDGDKPSDRRPSIEE